MKLSLVISIMLIASLGSIAYGENPKEFAYRLLPAKIVENTEGVMEVYAKDLSSPASIENLVVTSSDSSVIQILGVDKDEKNLVTNVRVKALHVGTTKIALAAPGFFSQEFPLTVYGIRHLPVQLLVKTTPNSFTINGPERGYVSVELVDEDGFPTRAVDDTTITLSTSDDVTIGLKIKDLVIKKGEYFATSEVDVNQSGEVLIYASAAGMHTASDKVNVRKESGPLTLQLYVYPNKIPSLAGSYSYAIVQLLDSNGIPIKAKETIPISLKIRSLDKTMINTSEDFTGILPDKVLEIKKGSYWGYTTLAIRAGMEGTYDVSISAKGLLVAGSAQLETKNIQFVDDKSAKLDLLPILATGNEELVGVLHLEDIEGNPIMASRDLQIKIDSSNEQSVSAKNVIIKKGTGAALVFGNVGSSKPDTLTLRVINDENQVVSPIIFASSLKLVAEPIIPKILTQSDFPVVLYLTKENGDVTYFPKDFELSVPPDEFIQTTPKVISKGQSVVLIDSKSLKPGDATQELQAGEFSTSMSINSLLSKPPAIHIDYPETILPNLEHTFSIQLLDEQGMPVFADHDINVRLVSNDQSVIEIPESVTIKKTNYYTLFGVKTKEGGKSEIAALTSDLPLAKFDVNVKDVTLHLTMTSPDHVNPNSSFEVKINTQNANSPLAGMKVEWRVLGALIKNMDAITDKNGNAKISLMSQDSNNIDVQVDVSGGSFSSVHASKKINVNQPLSAPVTPTDTNLASQSVFGVNPIFFVIAGVVAAAVVILKKKNMLDSIIEKIGLEEKILEVKAKMVELREK